MNSCFSFEMDIQRRSPITTTHMRDTLSHHLYTRTKHRHRKHLWTSHLLLWRWYCPNWNTKPTLQRWKSPRSMWLCRWWHKIHSQRTTPSIWQILQHHLPIRMRPRRNLYKRNWLRKSHL